MWTRRLVRVATLVSLSKLAQHVWVMPGMLAALPEVSQQCCDELAIQLLAMTRADRTAGRVSSEIPKTKVPPTGAQRVPNDF